MIRLTKSQFRKVKRLTRSLCANNDGGCCLLLDDGEGVICPQSISYSLLCRYFREAVLPADRELFAEITEVRDTRKKCEMCGKPFFARSNRAKFLRFLRPDCRETLRSRAQAPTARESTKGYGASIGSVATLPHIPAVLSRVRREFCLLGEPKPLI